MRRNAMQLVLLLLLLLLATSCRVRCDAGSDLRAWNASAAADDEDIGGEALRILRASSSSNSSIHLNETLLVEANVTVARMKANDTNVSKMVEKLLDSLDDDVQRDSGTFNDTINNQGGVLETVARVGHVEDEKLSTQEKQQDEEKGQGEDKPFSRGESEATPTVKEAAPDTVKSLLYNLTGSSSVPEVRRQAAPALLNTSVTQHLLNLTSSKLSEKKNATTSVSSKESRRHQSEDVARLIDREDNEYVISHPGKRSQMQFQEDFRLIRDIVTVIVASAAGALLCGLLGQPVILGYLAAGMVVGPGGLHLVHELVQVESLAQFGVIFLLFALGVEFSATKMQGVQAVALGGGCVQIVSAMILGGLLCSSVPQGIFIGAFLSMSSTAVVIKCMMDANIGGTEQGQILLGTLIFQDCALGLLLAVMPALAARGSSPWTILTALGRECLLLSAFCLVAWAVSKLVMSRLLSTLVRLSKNSSEMYLLGIVGICLCISLLSQSLGLGLEVGAFVAGLMLSGNPYSEKTLHQVEPVRNIFASLFLASIGMVMHPVFLWQHKDILLGSLGVMFFGKTFLTAIVVRAFGYGCSISLSVGIALAQIGEFSFVLLSRAQGLGLVSRKLYLLLMGTSAFSLVLTPFAFKVVVRLAPKERRNAQHYAFSLPSHGYAYHLDAAADSKKASEGKEPEDEKQSSGSKEGSGVFTPQVTMRRPFSQVFSGQWKDWKDLSELRGLYERR